jgi:hypothetical protein
MRPSITVLLNTIASSIADAAIDVHPHPMRGIPRYRNRHVAVKGSQSLRAPQHRTPRTAYPEELSLGKPSLFSHI